MKFPAFSGFLYVDIPVLFSFKNIFYSIYPENSGHFAQVISFGCPLSLTFSEERVFLIFCLTCLYPGKPSISKCGIPFYTSNKPHPLKGTAVSFKLFNVPLENFLRKFS
ncbi:MAG TPA: hypothetical protein DCZ91_01775 [Lachnospiraceae bacterium]|nr:hypothetical protein [Lachnospiraceae bacterium]